jgi:hypothetical protein
MDNSIKEKIHNAIKDPKVTFFIMPTPELKRLVLENIHPSIKGLRDEIKASILQDEVLPVTNQDVLDFIEKKLPANQHFLMSTGEIRVSRATDIIIK